MHSVITGGGGFIGLALAKHLVNQAKPSDKITLIDSLERHGKHPELDRILAFPFVDLIQADLTNPESLDQIPNPADRVYHFAAYVGVGPVTKAPAKVLRSNTLSTLNVFEWFSNNSNSGARLLFASTSEVYSGAGLSGFKLTIPTSECAPVVISDLDNPRFGYAIAKVWGEAFAKYLGVENNNNIFICVRYHNVYGPQMGNDHVIPQIIERVISREDPFKIIGADQTRSFCWIEDAVDATHRIMESPHITSGLVVHIGNQKGEVRIGHLYDMVFKLCGWKPLNLVNVPAPSGSVSRRCPDVTRLRSLTGYEPSSPLKQGLKATVKWYLEHSNDS